ncbi:MAG: hypothetical protein NZZ41_00495 [Candidatus Dojkabacteria bacterium]|nr:hypothetical protein [Candidatus Dojkabacteria bacterium]
MKFYEFFCFKIEELKNYTSIAFDLDGTLIGDNYYKHCFWDFISKNKNIDYFIVTFRERKECVSLWEEIEKESNGLLTKNNFKTHDFFIDNFVKQNNNELKLWKGFVCANIGAQILVDDMQELVIEGCKKYGIDFFNSKTLSLRKF